MNDTKERGEAPGLLTELMMLVEKCSPAFGQKRVFNRVLGLIMAEIFSFGRHTVTQLLLTLGLNDEDWSAWYRIFSKKRFKEEEVSAILLKEMIAEAPEGAPFVVGEDGFPVPRCSLKMAGSGWMRGLQTAKFKPGIQRGQRFVEGSWLPPIEKGYSRAVPIRCLSAFSKKSVASQDGPRTEVEAALSILHWTRRQLDEAGRSEQTLMTLNDGRYDTLQFWPGLPKRTIGLVRTARNRCLFELPAEDAHGNRKYGEKAPAPHIWLSRRKGFQHHNVLVRGRIRPMRIRVEGPYVRDELPDIPLFLIVVGGGRRPAGSRRKNYKPCFFLVSAVLIDGEWSLPLPIAELLAWLWQRWELEVAHRQMKSGLGLGEKQCWNPQATVASVQWTVWIYALMMFAGYRHWGNDPGTKPPGRWRSMPQRWSFNLLWRTLRAELWQQPHFRATWTRSCDNWLVNEPLWDNLFNSVLAFTRY